MKKSVEDTLINVALNEGNEIFFKILDDYPQLDEKDSRRDCILLSLFTNSIVQLYANGWSERELIREVLDWCDKAREIFDEEE